MTRTTIRIGRDDTSLADDLLDYSKLRVIMGSTERRGVWSVPRHLDVRVLMGPPRPVLRIVGDATLASCEIVRAA